MLSGQQSQAFDRDGFVAVPGVFHPEELAWFEGEVRSITLGYGMRPAPSRWSSDEAPAGTYIDVHRREEPFRRLATHPRLRELAAGLVAGLPALFRTRLCPGSRFGQGDPIWRRDFEIWQRTGALGESNALTMAIALDGQHPERPALHVIPGSHRVATGRPNPPASLSAPLGSVILLHCATRYALSRPRGTGASTLFLVTYKDGVRPGIAQVSPPLGLGVAHPHADRSLWPVPAWVAG